MRYFSALACLLFFSFASYGQSIGVRAGINLSKFSGPLEPGEAYDFSNGFHFGVNYGYKVTNKFMIRAEVVYTQTGTKTSYNGDSYYLIYQNDGSTGFELGKSEMTLDISNGVISVPLVAAYHVHPKIEVFGGLSFNFLINPIGRGQLRFESRDNAAGITFRQSLDYRYFEDEYKAASQLTNFGSARPITILVKGERVAIPKYAGAYYQELNPVPSKFAWFDVGATGGVNYFINKGFYVGARYYMGLKDITRTGADRALSALNEDLSYNRRTDKDVSTSIELSIGFRF